MHLRVDDAEISHETHVVESRRPTTATVAVGTAFAFLFGNGANVDSDSNAGPSPLHLAVADGRTDDAKVRHVLQNTCKRILQGRFPAQALIRGGAEIEAIDETGPESALLRRSVREGGHDKSESWTVCIFGRK